MGKGGGVLENEMAEIEKVCVDLSGSGAMIRL